MPSWQTGRRGESSEAPVTTVDNEILIRVESLLSLLKHRGLVDSKENRRDVDEVLTLVRKRLGYR